MPPNLLKLIKGKKKILVLIIVAALGWGGLTVSNTQVTQVLDAVLTEAPTTQTTTAKPEFNKASAISKKRRTHILYGDASGGGHLYGTGAPCKSEFPQNWDKNTVLNKIDLIAANDNLNWKKQRNGYYAAEQKIGNINIRVIKGRQNKQVITAYPLNTGRNPCPNPANDH